MTRRTSDAAVCCSNDSDSSLASRVALASSPAADEPRGRAVPIALGRFGAAGLRRRGLAEPALERPFMAFPEAQEAHGSGSDLGAESVGSKLSQKSRRGRTPRLPPVGRASCPERGRYYRGFKSPEFRLHHPWMNLMAAEIASSREPLILPSLGLGVWVTHAHSSRSIPFLMSY
jgi:hypothetical protein